MEGWKNLSLTTDEEEVTVDVDKEDIADTTNRLSDRNRVFRTGPWYFDKFLLVLELVSALVKPSDMAFNIVPFWLHFYDLPLACMNVTMAKKLGNAVGVYSKMWTVMQMGSCSD